MMKGYSKVDYNKFFSLSENKVTRGHNLKLEKSRSKLDIRKYFFSKRVVDMWNGLPQSVIDATSVNNLKNRYDRYINKTIS